MVLRVCRDVLGDQHDAEDASQATFLILARSARSIRRIDSLASWLFGVALRVAAKVRASDARRRTIERQGGAMKAQTAGTGERGDGWPELYQELERLPSRYQVPIVLCHLEGLSNEQAAGHLGLPVRTIQRRLAQGRERLRKRLVRRGWPNLRRKELRDSHFPHDFGRAPTVFFAFPQFYGQNSD
jgi:RNA polymerase sigma factor (sigma-70 family)